MAETFLQLPVDTSNTGKKIRYNSLVVGADTVHALGIYQTDPNTAANVQSVTAKGVQGSFAAAVQDLKDSGRVFVNAATAIAGVTCVTTEALVSLNISRDAAATAPATTIAVTAGKRLRVGAMVVGCITTGAAVLSGRLSLRCNPVGAVAATSPIITTAPISVPSALAQTGMPLVVPIPDGIEFSGTMQIGVSQVFSAITGTIWVSLISYEY